MNYFILCVAFGFACCFILSRTLILECRAAEMSLGQWMEWSSWSPCTERLYCLEGTRERSRDCELMKRCVGIEAESEGCPADTSCTDRPLLLDISHAETHSFIAVECETSVKYNASGKYAHIMKHNLGRMFPRGKSLIENSFYNIKITKKTLSFENDIVKYCFEPEIKTLTLEEFRAMFIAGTIKFKYASVLCPLPPPTEQRYVTGFAIGLETSGKAYGVYVQITTKSGFKTVYYKHMQGLYTDAYNLIWS